jgi:hypothetical protein
MIGGNGPSQQLYQRQLEVKRRIEAIESKLISKDYFNKTPGSSPRFVPKS